MRTSLCIYAVGLWVGQLTKSENNKDKFKNKFRLYLFMGMLDLRKTPLNVSPYINAGLIQSLISKSFGVIVLDSLELAIVDCLEACLTFCSTGMDPYIIFNWH